MSNSCQGRCYRHRFLLLSLAVSASLLIAGELLAKEAAGETLKLAEGRLQLEAPEAWKKVKPRVKFIEYEFAVPAAAEGGADGRVTVMGAGGTVQQNIDRWLGQFTQPDGKASKDVATVNTQKLSDVKLHTIDVSGTYGDRRGPFAPAVERPGYRMLAAIIETPQGNYFIKFYGEAKTVAAHAEAFEEMVEELQWK